MEHTPAGDGIGSRSSRIAAGNTRESRAATARMHTARVLPFGPRDHVTKCPPGSTSSARDEIARAAAASTSATSARCSHRGACRRSTAGSLPPATRGRRRQQPADRHRTADGRCRNCFSQRWRERREAGVPLAGSALAHALMLGRLCAADRGRASRPAAAARIDASNLVFLATPGPGGGGGGGGLKQPAPPPRAELRGHEPACAARSSPARSAGPEDRRRTKPSTALRTPSSPSQWSLRLRAQTAGAGAAGCCAGRDASRRCSAIAPGLPTDTVRGRTAAARAPRAASGLWRRNRDGRRRMARESARGPDGGTGGGTISAGQRHHAALAPPRSQTRLHRGRASSRASPATSSSRSSCEVTARVGDVRLQRGLGCGSRSAGDRGRPAMALLARPASGYARSTCSSRSRSSSSCGNPAHDHILCCSSRSLSVALAIGMGRRAGACVARSASAPMPESQRCPGWQWTTSCPNRSPHPTATTRSRTTCPTACSQSRRLHSPWRARHRDRRELLRCSRSSCSGSRRCVRRRRLQQAIRRTAATPLRAARARSHRQSGGGLDGQRTRAESARRPGRSPTSPPRCSCSDPNGSFLTSGRSSLEVPTLDPACRVRVCPSPFPVNGPVARYRVSFRDSTGHPVAHVDRRNPASLARNAPNTPNDNEEACMTPPRSLPVFAAVAFAAATVTAQQQAPPKDDRQSFRFRSAVELINVTTTVTDCERPVRFGPASGRLPRLRGRPGAADHALQQRASPRQPRHRARHERQHERREDERRPRRAPTASSVDLLDPEDEVFLYRFSNVPELVEGWTTNRERLLLAAQPASGPRAARRCTTPSLTPCRWQSRAGIARRHCSSSPTATTRTARRPSPRCKRQIRESEVMVYAIGIDSQSDDSDVGPGRAAGAPPAAIPLPVSASRCPEAAAGHPSRRARTPAREEEWTIA